LFQYLKAELPGLFNTKGVKWNFTKFLCGRDGVPYKRYSSLTAPNKISADIEKLLTKSPAAKTPILAAEERYEGSAGEGSMSEADESACQLSGSRTP
jgi:hypothetical protein